MKRTTNQQATYTALRRAGRDAQIDALRDGRKQRATTIPNKKRQAARTACRRPFTP